MSQPVLIFEKKGSIALLTLNRPQAANAINLALAAELEEACHRIGQDKGIRAVILTGAGDKAFCSGGDLKEFGQQLAAGDPDEVKKQALRHHATLALATLEPPLIAAVNGPALGLGLSLALACDLRLAADTAVFGVLDAARGMLPLSGITQRLPRLVGRGKALEMLLTAQVVNAREALRIGLVSQVLPTAQLLPQAEAWAEKMAQRGPLALRFAKEAVYKGLDLTLEQGLRLEADLYFLLQTTRDRVEGITAFREKRPSQFLGE